MQKDLGEAVSEIQPPDDEYKTRLVHIFDVFNEGIFHMDAEGNLTFYNPNFYTQFGIQTPTVHVSTWYALVHPLDQELLTSRVATHIDTPEQRMTTQYRVKKVDGEYLWVEGSAVCLREDGKTYMVGSHRDISDKKMMETYLKEAAFYDDSSSLFNLRKLLLDLDLLTQSPESHFSVIYIQINELQSYLVEYGSDLLQNVITCVKSAAKVFSPENAVLYRVSLDTYVVLLKGSVSHSLLKMLCTQFVLRYRTYMTKQSTLFANTMSIGIYPDCSHQFESEEILSIAFRTCAFASEKSQSQIEVYEGNTQKKVDRYFYIESGLKDALKTKSLSVKFQPIIDTTTGKVSSFEALVRWHSRNYGDIYPDEFIPVAENKGLIVELGYQVFEKACQFLSHYNCKNRASVRINVNVSVLQLLNSNFPDEMLRITLESGLKPASIILELTETVILDEHKYALQQINRLDELGFLLSLDDFGAGFSSINSFFDLPFDQIKIDRLFSMKTMQNNNSHQFLKFLIELCRKEQISVVIEGIENSEMLRRFQSMGASHLQGYWFSKPLSIANAMYYNPSHMMGADNHVTV
ncbi:sensor domain-containing protein [Vibrio mangrovi]|uniref:EAL domain-containing protein n=1 Tax=Vibrio mangrovi TaxID=474394 RepID=A0A1Y6IWN9_9VIBR|nr:EAL domain-containing protein [Vibrio mangrovi]MDW6004612.1 EAL domain-containing protein [Vibrio mangrovi]SMS00902.1 Phytochrome-like protein cph2 [Vibrio mangrovi]